MTSSQFTYETFGFNNNIFKLSFVIDKALYRGADKNNIEIRPDRTYRGCDMIYHASGKLVLEKHLSSSSEFSVKRVAP